MDLSGLWQLGRYDCSLETGTDDDLQHQVSAAHRDWVVAQQHFQNVCEPELVDHAVHSIIAAESKYKYWLRRLREQQGRFGDQG